MTFSTLIDTHCHLNDYFKPIEVVEEAARVSVRIIAVTRLPSEFPVFAKRYSAYANVRVALGIHPLLVDKMSAHQWQVFEKYFDEAKYIGEVGLDFSLEGRQSRTHQEQAFARVLERVVREPRLITVHSRSAAKRVHELLEQSRSMPVVHHWYTGSFDVAEALLARRDYFSLNPSMMASGKGRALALRLPHERVLLESDGPFTRIGKRPSWPSDIREVARSLATTWGCEVSDVAKTVNRNFKTLTALFQRESG